MEEPEQHDQRLLGVVDLEQRGGEIGDVARHKQGAGPARLGLPEVLAIGEEGHLIRPRDVERPKKGVSGDSQVGDQDLSSRLRAQQDSNKEDGQAHHRGDEDRTRKGNLVGGRV